MNNHQSHSEGPLQGVGVGLRSCHYQYILAHLPEVPWLEILSDNYLMSGGSDLQYLMAIRAHYPVAMHGVGLSIGSTDPLNRDYLNKLKQLANRVEPQLISDHLCWISVDGHYLHDLLPLPYTEEAITHVVARIKTIQDFLGQQILIENASSYMQYQQSEMTEWQFINEIATRADCFILLDVNNVYVSAHNHGFDPYEYIQEIKLDRVRQFHLAGYQDKQRYLFDTHNELVHQPVWDCYKAAVERFGSVPTLIEWDSDIPPFNVLQQEANKAQAIIDEFVAIQAE